MSKIDFREGSLTGRLTGMVGASWKGIQYVRKMVIPANPNTTAQQGTRTVFSKLVAFGRRINSTILKDFIKPKPKKMSPFNKFIQNNQPMIDAGTFSYADLVISKGSLYLVGDLSLTPNTTNNQVTFQWNNATAGEALPTDPAICTCYNESYDIYGFKTDVNRSASEAVVDIEVDVGNVIHGYLFFVQGDDLASETLQETVDPVT